MKLHYNVPIYLVSDCLIFFWYWAWWGNWWTFNLYASDFVSKSIYWQFSSWLFHVQGLIIMINVLVYDKHWHASIFTCVRLIIESNQNPLLRFPLKNSPEHYVFTISVEQYMNYAYFLCLNLLTLRFCSL